MIKGLLKYFLSLVILLHCMGVTQLASACCKNSSTFVSMLNINEEETKKEKESKEDDCSKHFRQTQLELPAGIALTGRLIYFCDSKSRCLYQVVIENPTPPPDSRV
jgi:hypothetical protein